MALKIGENMENNNMTANQQEERTFSQSELNAIIGKRLSEQKQQQESELAKREQELKEKEFRFNSRQKLIERGYPEDLLDILNCGDEASLDKSLSVIDKIIGERSTAPSDIRITSLKGMDHVQRNSKDENIRSAMGLS